MSLRYEPASEPLRYRPGTYRGGLPASTGAGGREELESAVVKWVQSGGSLAVPLGPSSGKVGPAVVKRG